MNMKSLSECVNFVVHMIICNVEKSAGIGNLEEIRKYMMRMYKETFIEDMVAMSAILSQISLIIEKFYLDK